MQIPDYYQCTHLETNDRTKRALKSTIIEMQTLCMKTLPLYMVYVCVCPVSRSHFADPKMADPANVWDLSIKIFLTLEV